MKKSDLEEALQYLMLFAVMLFGVGLFGLSIAIVKTMISLWEAGMPL